MRQKSFIKKKRYILPLVVLAIILGFVVFFKITVILAPPAVSDLSALNLKRNKIAEDIYTVEDSWLKKNKYGLWELYISGNDFELGAKNGVLTKELIEYQEEAFVEKIKEMIPSDFYLNFLKYFISWFNKDIDEHIPLEYQKEIYGISFNASNKYDFIAPSYHRILNYHAAHDIGHTLQNMNLVACTGFGVKGARSEDSTLLIGRNMDFYFGDKFAENKIIAFYQPEHGYNFAFITWGGLMGVLSGMNDQGLTVTLNAAKSSIPSSAKTPVSILARKIVQYASTIEEAYKIASDYETFVSESFLIASAKDNQVVIIEKTPDNIELYQRDEDEIILTNHFQGENNNSGQNESSSAYRWKRTEELLNEVERHNANSFAAILRDKKGLGGENIGMGNEKAINQLIAHHSVIFKPKQLQIWVSTSPFQLGEYIAYDLNTMFSDSLNILADVFDTLLTIEADPFKDAEEYNRFEEYKRITQQLQENMHKEPIASVDEVFLERYRTLNPEYFYTYYMIGEYYRMAGNNDKAIKYFNWALEKEIPRIEEENLIKEKLKLLVED